jgi:hypothetical protein
MCIYMCILKNAYILNVCKHINIHICIGTSDNMGGSKYKIESSQKLNSSKKRKDKNGVRNRSNVLEGIT